VWKSPNTSRKSPPWRSALISAVLPAEASWVANPSLIRCTNPLRLRVVRPRQGFDAGQLILYLSTDAGQPLTAVLERSVYVPPLNNAAFNGGDDFLGSARERLFGFINGQAGQGRIR
jgi:hypothetical protein